MADNDDYLKFQHPQTGRRLKENAEVFNEADYAFLKDLSDPTAAIFRGDGHFWSHLRENLATSDVFYYSLVLSATKHTVVYARELSAGQGPVRFESVFGATYTPGTVVPSVALFAGKPAADAVITAGPTGVTGGVEGLIDFVFGQGNKVAVAGSAGLVTIFPPGTELLLKITNEASGTNPGIDLSLGFAELEIPNDLV